MNNDHAYLTFAKCFKLDRQYDADDILSYCTKKLEKASQLICNGQGLSVTPT